MGDDSPASGRIAAPSDREPSEFGTWQSSDDAELESHRIHTSHALATRTEGPTGPIGRAVMLPVGVSIGRYRLRDELGRGGMGVVYRAYDPELGREVALKVVRAGRDASDSQQRRFSREARAVALLKHPNIVEVYDMGTHEGGVYYTMECVDGSSLAHRIGGQPMEPREAARLAVGIARALACAHEAGLIHRDVKPGNVLVDGDTPKLTDFGLVKRLDNSEATAVLTHGGQMLGTPAYMAPEQLAGDSDAVVPATDQYALGIILFEMLSGQRPFRGVGSSELVQRMTEVEPPRLPVSGVPRELDLIRRRTMTLAPDERYPDCAESADDLERFLAGTPVRASSPGLWRQTRWLWRRYWRRIAVAAAVVAAVVGGVQLRDAWSSWQRDRARARHESAAESRRLAMEERIAELLTNGERDKADQLFETFTLFEGNRGTRAMARAWLQRGQRLRAQEQSAHGGDRPDAADALDALAAAYATTEEVVIQGRALVEMAEIFRARDRWSQLSVLLATMGERTPAALAAPRMRHTHLDGLLAQRDIARAAALAARPDDDGAAALAPLLAHLQQARKTAVRADTGHIWDADGDGQPEAVLYSRRGAAYSLVELSRTDGTLRLRQRAPLAGRLLLAPSVEPLILGQGGESLLFTGYPSWVVASMGADDMLENRVFDARVPVGRFEASEANVFADLDGDGRAEHHLSVGVNGLYQLLEEPDGNWSIIAHSEVNAMPARVSAMVASDLDGDGTMELVVGTRGWSRYDIQLLRAAQARPGDPPGFTPLQVVGRQQFGDVSQMTVLDTAEERLLAVMQSHDPAKPLNHRLFAADGPQGATQGIHLMALVDGRLEPRGLIPLPKIDDGRGHTLQDLWTNLADVEFLTADLDDDGRDELILGAQEHGIFIYRGSPEDGFRELAIVDTQLVALAQLDADPMLEMLVSLPDRDGEIWLLGVGEERLPLGPAAALERSQNGPATADGLRSPLANRDLAARWQRSEDLFAIGLTRAAVVQMREVAALAIGSVDEERALLRAGQMLLDAGAHAEAGALFTRAAARPETATRAWEAALNAYRADMRWREAASAAEQRLALPAPPDWVRTSARRLRARASALVSRFDFRTGIDRAWQILVPFQLRTSHRGAGLQVTTGGHPPGDFGTRLMRLPVVRNGDDLRVTMDFELERIDWAGYFRFLLHDAGEDHFLLGIHYRGGGGLYELHIRCLDAVPLVIRDLDGLLGIPLRLEWRQTSEGLASCALVSEGGVADRRLVYRMPKPVPLQGPAALVLENNGAGAPASVQALVRGVEMAGLQVDPDASPSPIHQANRQLTMGRPDAALPILLQLEAENPGIRGELAWQLSRVAVAEALGDATTTAAVLRAAMAAEPTLQGHLGHLFRHQLDRFEKPLRAILGASYYVWFADVTLPTLGAHRREGRMLELVRDHLDGLEALPVFPELPEERAGAGQAAAIARVELQFWRARKQRLDGRVALAMRTLEAVQEMAEKLDSESGELAPSLQRQIDEIRYMAGTELAVCRLFRGEPERAIDTLLATIGDTRAPDVTADRVAAQLEFAGLRSHPRWPDIERVRTMWSTDER